MRYESYATESYYLDTYEGILQNFNRKLSGKLYADRQNLSTRMQTK